MGDNGNWTKIGEQILGSVADALQTGDFDELNGLVSETVKSALQEAKAQNEKTRARERERLRREQAEQERLRREQERIRQEQERIRQEREQRERQRRERERRRQQESARKHEKQRQEKESRSLQVQKQPLVKMREVGGVSGVLFTVFGGIGLGFSAIGLFIFLVTMLFGFFSWSRLVAALVPTVFFAGMIQSGIFQKNRLDRAKQYVRLCGQKMYGEIAELAGQTGRSVRYVRRDLRKMLQKGIFPEGHLDEKETCFMLNDTLYDQYRQTAKAYKQEEAEKNAPKSLSEQVAEEQQARDAELAAMVAEGNTYIRKLRDLNDNIPGESISERLFRLENLLHEIFERVKEHPEQMYRMHKLMDYYLPTMVKLVEAYAEFDKVSAPGEDIIAAKAEIEKTLGIINQAFSELLNTLFQDAAMDVTTDAQVLQTMLAREGLTREMETVKVNKE